ncbi:class F sortase [Propionibacteriaceae bacterium Y2011]|uniref:class F sortase n=1 Tax=Microlunatus sp. Y2014 TaxID=3418488 RepID=UPI003B4C8AB8
MPTAEVTRLRIDGVLSATAGAPISPDPRTNILTPPNSSQVFRWAERGRPGTGARDTVYLLGHTVRAGGGVFDRLQTVTPGQVIMVDTTTGSLQYKVSAVKLYPRDSIQHADEVYATVPGRLVLIGCYLNADGSRQDRNVVVFAQRT